MKDQWADRRQGNRTLEDAPGAMTHLVCSSSDGVPRRLDKRLAVRNRLFAPRKVSVI
jgi:hypothetical protein